MLSIVRNHKDVLIREYEGGTSRVRLNSDRDARLLEACESMMVLLNVSLHVLDQCSDRIEDDDFAELLDDVATRIKRQIDFVEHGTSGIRRAG